MSKPKTSDLEKTEIKEKLQKALKNSHLSQMELAKRTKIPIGTIRAYLSGSRCPRYENAVIIAEKLGVGVGAFLTSEQKKHENKSESDTFLRKNSAYVALLRSLNYRCDVVYDDTLGIKCSVSAKSLPVSANRNYREIVSQVKEYESGRLPDLTNNEITKLYDDYYSFPIIHQNGMILDLNTEQWENFRREISSAVKEIVNKHIDAAVKEREMQKKEQTTQRITADLLKTINAVNAVLPALSGETSGAIDPKALETLKQVSERYKH